MTSSTTTQTSTLPNFKATLDTTHDTNIEIPRGPVTSSLIFYAPPPDGSAPWNYVETPPEGSPQRNYGEHPHEVHIEDIRGRESSFHLNRDAFATISGVSSEEKEFTDDDHIKKVYYPEVEKLLLDNIEGAQRVLLFDHTIRRSDPNAARAPVNRAHIDQTVASTQLRVQYHLPDEAEELLKGRYRIINVWRPLNGPVVASPLAFAASHTVKDDSIVPVQHRYPHRTGETAGVKYDDGMKWYYWSGMTNDERLLLQCCDSKDGARVPHSAFVDPRTQPHFPGRESIEVRALVFG
ncbi:hypothetical protein M8818_001335 [Zalaria obscura]|uniref:Uncharacterized protein n=1 Tax=Zalaria obscura TaxID=2024903 RepID=A0ACC3SL91_9PEZI